MPSPYDYDPRLLEQANQIAGQPMAMAEPQPVALEPVAVQQSTPVVVQAPPPVDVVPPHLNQALEVAGEAPVQAPAYLNRNQKSGAILADADAAKNRLLDNATAQGENASGMHAQAAAINGEDSTSQKKRLGETDARVTKSREQSDAYAEKARAHVEEMEATLKEGPPKHTLQTVMGIIAAVVGGGGGAGHIASAIGQHIGGAGADEWKTKISAHGELAKSFEGLSHDRDAHSESDIHQQNGLVAAQTAMYASALKQVSETAQSEGVRLDAAEARDKLLNGYAEAAYQQKYAQEEAAKKKGAGAQRTERENEIYKALTAIQDPQQRAVVAGQFGKLGQTVLQDVQKSDANVAQLGATAASTENTLANANKAAGEAAAGKPLTAEQAKTDAVVAGAVPAYQRLHQVVASGGVNRGATKETWLPDALTSQDSLRQRADQNQLLMQILRVESGSNVPEHELAGKRAALGLDSGDPDIRAQANKDLLTSFAALDRQGRLAQAGQVQGIVGTPTVAKPLAPAPVVSGQLGDAAAQKVAMTNPDTGDVQLVKPSLVEMFARKGYVKGGRTLVSAGIPRDDTAGATNTAIRPEGGI
jgi:hypothetical protein